MLKRRRRAVRERGILFVPPALYRVPRLQIAFEVEHGANQNTFTALLPILFGETFNERMQKPDRRIFMMRIPAYAAASVASAHRIASRAARTVAGSRVARIGQPKRAMD